MATRSKDRVKNVVIIVIVGLFVVSSIAGTLLLALQGSGDTKTAAEIQQERMIKELQEQQSKEQADVQHEPLEGYESEPFDADSVKELKVEVIKAGDGRAAAGDSTVKVNYFGWTSDGKIFDTTSSEGKSEPREIPLDQVIQGWQEGLVDVKEGSIVKLTIPTDMAYGEGSAGMGSPQGPLRFIVEMVEVK